MLPLFRGEKTTKMEEGPADQSRRTSMLQTKRELFEQDLRRTPKKAAMASESTVSEVPDLEEGVIPTIELRAATFNDSSEATADALHTASPTPSSPGLTACETSSTISIEDGVELQNLTEGDRQKMLEDVFTQLDLLVGLPHVKDQFREIKKRIEAYKKQGVNLRRERFHIKFLGNPGTGKCRLSLPG